ncbi:hypothetical protein H4R35_002833 [Dimargaris xerosporica]|nr:hypothetical protein H4R35_002833 [Dimargaris xerosporica]
MWQRYSIWTGALLVAGQFGHIVTGAPGHRGQYVSTKAFLDNSQAQLQQALGLTHEHDHPSGADTRSKAVIWQDMIPLLAAPFSKMGRYFEAKLDFQYKAIQAQRSDDSSKPRKSFSVMPWNRFGDDEVHKYVVSWHED